MGQKGAFVSSPMVPPSLQKIRAKQVTNRIMNAVKMKRKTSVEAIVSERRPILEMIFAPKSVAVIGASETSGCAGGALIEKLAQFQRPYFPNKSGESESAQYRRVLDD
jgi:hypothetical protein